MKQTALLGFLLLFLFPNVLFADATPFKKRLKVNIDFHNSKGDTLQKCCALFYCTGKTLDTVCACDGPTCLVFENNTIEITRHVPESFQLLFTIGGETLISPMLYENGMKTQIDLNITDGKITETTPFFKVPFGDYLLALLITLLIESAISASFFIAKKIALKNLSVIVICNVISHPILWLTCSYLTGWGFHLFLGEIVVVIFEGLFIFMLLKNQIKIYNALLLSFVMNMISYIFGGLLYYFLI